MRLAGAQGEAQGRHLKDHTTHFQLTFEKISSHFFLRLLNPSPLKVFYQYIDMS
jgi:hypothetical protein